MDTEGPTNRHWQMPARWSVIETISDYLFRVADWRWWIGLDSSERYGGVAPCNHLW